MKAIDLMTADHLWVCSDYTDVRQAAELMKLHNIGFIPVVDGEGKLEGAITDRDLCCRIVAEGRSFETPVKEVMTSPVHCINQDADLSEVETLMRDYRIRRLPVVDDNQMLKGVISIGDLAKHCHGLWKEHHVAETLESVSTT